MAFPPRSARSLVAGLLAACALATAPPAVRPVAAAEIGSATVGRADDWVAVAVRMAAVLSDRARGSLERGMPATVTVSAELWRSRAGWFDQFIGAEQGEVRLWRDAWSDEYLLVRNRGPQKTLANLDDVEVELRRPQRIRIVPAAVVTPGETYYAIVRVDVKLLNVEDIGEVERWLSGEAKRVGKPGPGSIAKLPVSMVNVLANLSGLGDETAMYRTGTFSAADMGPAGPRR
jgi:hypothetical protein